MQATGWLLDLYEHDRQSVVLWLIAEDGLRLRLHQSFSITFYAAGPQTRLHDLVAFLRSQPIKLNLGREERRDLFQEQRLMVLTIRVENAAEQPRLFRRVAEHFPDLEYYDADIQLSLRYAALHNTFCMARCRVQYEEDGELNSLEVLDSPWELDPEPPPLRVLTLRPDCDPQHAPPSELIIHAGRQEYHLGLKPERPLLINLRAILQRHDPDLIISMAGDTWLLPELLKMSARLHIPLPLNREEGREVRYKKEGTYFSYGQIIYRGQQVHLYGRCHIDGRNAMMWQDYDLDGALETARITGLPLQVAARVSPGTGISSMQITTALRNHILVPWHKQQAEQTKTALDLLRYDQGGLVYQPITGLHFNVGMIDFISMYPSIMVRCNISPETPRPTELGKSAYPPGLVPQTLEPLLDKRVALKQRALSLPCWDPRRKRDKSRSAAQKWLLVPCLVTWVIKMPVSDASRRMNPSPPGAGKRCYAPRKLPRTWALPCCICMWMACGCKRPAAVNRRIFSPCWKKWRSAPLCRWRWTASTAGWRFCPRVWTGAHRCPTATLASSRMDQQRRAELNCVGATAPLLLYGCRTRCLSAWHGRRTLNIFPRGWRKPLHCCAAGCRNCALGRCRSKSYW